jgi:hypothetical protein
MPVGKKIPPIIVSRDFITLDQLAIGSATVPENLSAECQRLYANVAGKNIALDTPDFPEFSVAIERSVNTEGLLCQRMLKKKASEFGKENYKTTYLRITLGADSGNSPGAPYVLEIWPDLHAYVSVMPSRMRCQFNVWLSGPLSITTPIHMPSSRYCTVKSRRTILHRFLAIDSRLDRRPTSKRAMLPGLIRKITRFTCFQTRVSPSFFWLHRGR